jgi:hypothetical protein
MKRPTTLEGMIRGLEGFRTEESLARGLAFRPRPTDVFISPYAKCGTTWMQQIVHTLRTRGDMDFGEISEVVPWIEMTHDLGQDPEAPQKGEPRAFKSHLTWDEIPKGGKYICVFREPRDACLSMYKFFDGWFFERGAIDFETFARDFYLARDPGRTYWDHTASWWSAAGRDDVLLLCFEDLKRDLREIVERVAAFIGIPLDDGLRDIVLEHASFAFMKRHDTQFDDHVTRQHRDAACGLPPGGSATKVSEGNTGQAKPLLSDAVQAAFDTRWRETLGARFGLSGYDDLRAATAALAR